MLCPALCLIRSVGSHRPADLAAGARASELSVDAGAVLSCHDRDGAEMIVNAVAHAVVARLALKRPLQGEFERLAYAMRALGRDP